MNPPEGSRAYTWLDILGESAYSFSQSIWCISHITIYICLVQPSQHLVICAHDSSSFSFLPTNCKCFWTCINCFHILAAVL